MPLMPVAWWRSSSFLKSIAWKASNIGNTAMKTIVPWKRFLQFCFQCNWTIEWFSDGRSWFLLQRIERWRRLSNVLCLRKGLGRMGEERWRLEWAREACTELLLHKDPSSPRWLDREFRLRVVGNVRNTIRFQTQQLIDLASTVIQNYLTIQHNRKMAALQKRIEEITTAIKHHQFWYQPSTPVLSFSIRSNHIDDFTLPWNEFPYFQCFTRGFTWLLLLLLNR